MPLSDIAINRKLKGKNKPYKIADGGGLYLLIKPDGSKYWRLKYRHASKEKLLAIGIYPEITLSEARAARDSAKRLIKEGKDPVSVKRQQRQAAATAAANTFEVVAREWMTKQERRWTPDHAQRVLNSLQVDIFPELGREPIGTIKAAALLATIRKVEKRGALETAQRLVQRCNSVFRYGITTDRCEYNPAGDLRGALETRKAENHAALTARELPEFLAALASYEGRPETKLALRLLILTWVRSGELRAAEWGEFDLDGAQWIIPAERMKMGTEHIVPLSRQALAVLDDLRHITGSGRVLFPSLTNPNACISENTMLYALYRMGYHSRATVHGFRATASTIMNEMGWNPDAIERQLAHVERNKVRAAYHRSQYLPGRREMMQVWADYLSASEVGGNVLPIRKVI